MKMQREVTNLEDDSQFQDDEVYILALGLEHPNLLSIKSNFLH